MNAPFIWIGLPAVIGGLLFLLRVYRRTVNYLGIFISIWLSLAAWLLPIGEVVTMGNRAFRIEEQFLILGRSFTLLNSDRAVLILIYFLLALWLIGGLLAQPRIGFVSFSFVFTALMIAALAVEPFLYAALLFEISVLLAVPFLSPSDQKPGSGIFRFLTFQSLGMPLILLAGWFLAGLEASPGESDLVLRAGILIGVGLAFLLSVVPFHSWIPTLAGESEPYLVAFILFMFPAVVSIFGLGFLDRFVWMRDSQAVYFSLRIVGVLMIVVGGGWMSVEKHLGRMLGYAAIAENGISLLAVGLGSRVGYLIFFWLMFVRIFSYMPWAVAVSRLNHHHQGELRLGKLWGRGYQTPLAASMAVIGISSLLGLPLLAGYSARFALWREVSSVAPTLAIAALVGNTGLLIGGLRALNALFIPFEEDISFSPLSENPEEVRWNIRDNFFSLTLYLCWLLTMTAIGFFPQLYLSAIEKLLFIFERLSS
jgi:NADH-quinone oxidoreductase subunit N